MREGLRHILTQKREKIVVADFCKEFKTKFCCFFDQNGGSFSNYSKLFLALLYRSKINVWYKFGQNKLSVLDAKCMPTDIWRYRQQNYTAISIKRNIYLYSGYPKMDIFFRKLKLDFLV